MINRTNSLEQHGESQLLEGEPRRVLLRQTSAMTMGRRRLLPVPLAIIEPFVHNNESLTLRSTQLPNIAAHRYFYNTAVSLITFTIRMCYFFPIRRKNKEFYKCDFPVVKLKTSCTCFEITWAILSNYFDLKYNYERGILS